MTTPTSILPSITDIRAAHRTINPIIHRTPILSCRSLSELAKGDLLFKCENFQKGGSFKIRGAYNKVSSLSPEERKRGIVTFSSGNHAQGVALAAKLHDIRATVFMPEDSPPVKLDAVHEYGGEAILAGTNSSERKRAALRFAEDTGAAVIPPFDDFHIIAGQGTIGLEIVDELKQRDTIKELERIVIPIGGGGLISGIAIAMNSLLPDVEIIGVEPGLACKMSHSLAQKKISEVTPGDTVADGLKPVSPGALNFCAAQRYVDRIVTLDEHEIVRATKLLIERAKLVVEPSGATPLAACLSPRIDCSPGKTMLILSGGNIDLPAFFSRTG